MRAYKLKRETMEGTFSFLNAQLTIGVLSMPDGTKTKGFTFEQMVPHATYQFALSDEQAQAFITCLKQVERKKLPNQFQLRFGFKNWCSLTFKFRKYDPKWHGGGGIKGSFTMNMVLSIRGEPIKMSLNVISELRACLERVYGIQVESAVVSGSA